jgi:serine/threonine protein kinase
MYMAPELFGELQNSEKYTTAVDVFAYAMVLYELVTLRKPWELPDNDKQGTLNTFKIIGYLQKGLRPSIPDHVSPAYRELIEACWVHDPERRPTFRDIVSQIRGDRLAFPSTDLDEFADYQNEMLNALQDSR